MNEGAGARSGLAATSETARRSVAPGEAGGPSRTLLLVRHGETTWNAERRLQGQVDVPLSERGRRHVRALRRLVERYEPERAVTSDLARARETAALLGFADATVDARWREAHLGLWQGKGIDVLRREDEVRYEAWRAGEITPEAAEPWAEVCARIKIAVRELAAGSVLVVTHGGPIRAVCATLLGLAPRSLVPVSPASLTIVELAGGPRLRAFNLTAYEDGAEPPD